MEAAFWVALGELQEASAGVLSEAAATASSNRRESLGAFLLALTAPSYLAQPLRIPVRLLRCICDCEC